MIRGAAPAAVLCLVLAGCGPFASFQDAQNRSDEPAGVLGDGRSVGERFDVHCGDVSALDVQIARYPTVADTGGTITFAVDSLGATVQRLAEVTYREADLTANEWIRLPIQSAESPPPTTLQLTATASDPDIAPTTVWATSHLASPDVTRYLGSQKVPGALTLRPYCDQPPLEIARTTLVRVSRDGLLWPVAVFLCVLPGLLLVHVLNRKIPDVATRLGLAAGWSVLLAPLTLVALTPARAASFGGVVLLTVGALGLIVVLRHQRGSITAFAKPDRTKSSFPAEPQSDEARDESNRTKSDHGHGVRLRPARPASVALIATVGAVVVRLVTARDLIAPMWVDSVQHSYIVGLILQSGGVPTTFGVASPTEPFDYHFGFHALAAFAAELSGASPAASVLAVGQILSTLLPLSVYTFARQMVRSDRAGAIAALLVALVTTQPTYSTTWGRYPELAGLVALPAVFAAVRLDPTRDWSWSRLILGTIALTGVFLTHPRIAVLVATLLAADTVVATVRLHRRRWPPDRDSVERVVKAIAQFASTVCLTGLLLLPWLARLRQSFNGFAGTPLDWQPINFPLTDAAAGPDGVVLGLAIVGVVVAIARGRSGGWVMVGWCALTLVAANPLAFHLSIFPWLSNESVAIALFFPGSVFAGYAIAALGDLLHFTTWPGSLRAAAGIGAIAAALSQTPGLVGAIHPCCTLLNPADVEAMSWVAQNTPSDARFLIDAREWSPGIWAGVDAGYWLWVLGPRQTTVPPLFYANGPTESREEVNQLAAAVERDAGVPADLARDARGAGARYVFVGSQGGPIDPGGLLGSSEFREVYGRDGAWVFEVVPAVGLGETTGFSGTDVVTGDVAPGGVTRSTVTEMTPVASGSPSRTKAAGLRSTTWG
jgi:hypothetical protein